MSLTTHGRHITISIFLFVRQLLSADSGSPAWGFCGQPLDWGCIALEILHDPLFAFSAPVADYDAARADAKHSFASSVDDVRGLVAKMQKAQRAAEQSLDMSAHIYNK